MIETKPNDPRYKIDKSRPVFVYKNLHKDCWSIRQDGLVKAHATAVSLWDCHFRVNKKGREKVLEQKCKNVHAGIKGFIDTANPPIRSGIYVTYNPYKYESFVDRDTKDPVYYSLFTRLTKNKVFAKEL